MKTALSILFLSLALLMAPCAESLPGALSGVPVAFAAGSEGSVAMVSNILGSATVGRGGRPTALRKGMLLADNDKLTLGPKSAVKIQFTDGSVTTLFEGTDVVLGTAKVRKDGSLEATMDVVKGKVRFFVKPKSVPNAVRFKTSNAVMGVRGTSGVIVVEKGRSELFVTTGRVDVRSSVLKDAVAVPVSAGFATAVLRQAAPTAPRSFDAATLARDPFGVGGSAVEAAPGLGDGPEASPDTSPREEKGNEAPDAREPKPQGEGEGGGTSQGNGPSPEAAPAPKARAVFMPDGAQGVVVVGGNVEALMGVPPVLQAPLRDAQEAVRTSTTNAGKAVEQITRDAATRAQSAAPSARRKIPVDVRVEGW